jgi:hypothetical protein
VDGGHRGYHADEGAYENYARSVDPLGDEIKGAGAAHVAPHVNLSGDGLSAMGGESGFTGAYAARMQSLHDRVTKLGGKWHQVSEASRRTRANYDAVEADHDGMLKNVRKELG